MELVPQILRRGRRGVGRGHVFADRDVVALLKLDHRAEGRGQQGVAFRELRLAHHQRSLGAVFQTIGHFCELRRQDVERPVHRVQLLDDFLSAGDRGVTAHVTQRLREIISRLLRRLQFLFGAVDRPGGFIEMRAERFRVLADADVGFAQIIERLRLALGGLGGAPGRIHRLVLLCRALGKQAHEFTQTRCCSADEIGQSRPLADPAADRPCRRTPRPPQRRLCQDPKERCRAQ